MKKKDKLIVGLDVGTTKVCAVIGEATMDGVDVIGIGTHPSSGLRKGVIVNIESTINSIVKAVEEAELMAGCEVGSVYAQTSGSHVRSFNSHGVVAINGHEAKESDLVRVIDAAKAVNIPMDSEVIHVIPQDYIIDDQDGIKKPIGMSGVRLESKVHIITAGIAPVQNIIKCSNRAGLNVQNIVLGQLASAEAILCQDEKELGVILIDIGGGTSDIIIYADGSVKYTSVLNIGGNHITNDIAVGLRTPINEANKIKEKHGCAMASMVTESESLEVPSVGGRTPRIISRKILAEIIEARTEEILSLIRREIIKSGYEETAASGIVLTGGTTIMEGFPELGEKILGMPVRRGIPSGVGGLLDIISSPMYATATGLLIYGAKQDQYSNFFRMKEENVYSRTKTRVREWLSDFF